jgi:hypothetical protein
MNHLEFSDEQLFDYIDGNAAEQISAKISKRMAIDKSFKEYIESLSRIDRELKLCSIDFPNPNFTSQVVKSWNEQRLTFPQSRKSFFQSAHGVFTIMILFFIAIMVIVLYAANGTAGTPEYMNYVTEYNVVKNITQNVPGYYPVLFKELLINVSLVLLAVIGLFIIDLYVLRTMFRKSKPIYNLF